MKKLTVLIFIVSLLLLATACDSDVITYDNPGTIVINILNDNIVARDILILTSDDNVDITRSGQTITIVQDKMIRIMVTLSLEGYVSRNFVVKSLDYNDNHEYTIDITFEPAYIAMELNVITDADEEDIEITGDEIISIARLGKIFDIQLSKAEDVNLTVSAGEQYNDYIIELSEEEISNGISSRTLMLLSEEYLVVEYQSNAGDRVEIHSSSTEQMYNHKQGLNMLFGIAKDNNAEIRVYDDQYNYVGQYELTIGFMADKSLINLSNNDLSVYIRLIASPYNYTYMTEQWIVIAEKQGDNYIPLYSNYYYNNIETHMLFDKSKVYYVFTMGYDGLVRYKELEIELSINDGWNNKKLDVEFDTDDPVRDVQVKLVDYTENTDDFNDVSVISSNPAYQLMGTIVTGNTLNLIPNSYYRGIGLVFNSMNYSYMYYDSYHEDYLYSLALDGIIEITVFTDFELYIDIDSTISYEGAYVSHLYMGDPIAVVDENNTLFIEDFSFDKQYILHYDSNVYYIGNQLNTDNIYKDNEDFRVTVIV